MMAAVSAAKRETAVTLLEPNERLGKKLNITGKGRCNLTNHAGLEELLANIPRNGKFLYSAFSRFSAQDTMALFEDLGVPLKTERGNRVFPVSDRAFDVSAALERRLKKLGVRIVRDRATHLELASGVVRGVTGERKRYPAEAVILATGGVSYPATGSTGEGHRMAKETGHTVTPLRGSLVPLRDFGVGKTLQGLSLRNVELTVFEDSKKIYTDFGELMFTHFGLSGPLVLSASAHMRRFGERAYHLEIDLMPKKLIPEIIRASEIDPRQKVHNITREQRRGLLRILKHFPVAIAGPCPVTDAIVTSGGVKVTEIDPATMESKLARGLYFAGEIIDVDGYTGGFNLQIAWSTGWAAGFSAADTK